MPLTTLTRRRRSDAVDGLVRRQREHRREWRDPLANASNVSLTNVDINGTEQHGINGNTLPISISRNSTIQNTGNGAIKELPGSNIISTYGRRRLLATTASFPVPRQNTGQFNIVVQNNEATNSAGSPTTYGASTATPWMR